MRYLEKQSGKNESYRNEVLSSAVLTDPSDALVNSEGIKQTVNRDTLVVSDVSNAQNF